MYDDVVEEQSSSGPRQLGERREERAEEVGVDQMDEQVKGSSQDKIKLVPPPSVPIKT